jgi:hypothetical protein
MRIISYIVAAVLLILGGIWILQGLNLVPDSLSMLRRSFMMGRVQWAIYGAILAALGVLLIVWTRRRKA